MRGTLIATVFIVVVSSTLAHFGPRMLAGIRSNTYYTWDRAQQRYVVKVGDIPSKDAWKMVATTFTATIYIAGDWTKTVDQEGRTVIVSPEEQRRVRAVGEARFRAADEAARRSIR